MFRIQQAPGHLLRGGGVRFHRLDDMRGLIRISKARRAGRGADAFHVEQDEQRFGLDASRKSSQSTVYS